MVAVVVSGAKVMVAGCVCPAVVADTVVAPAVVFVTLTVTTPLLSVVSVTEPGCAPWSVVTVTDWFASGLPFASVTVYATSILLRPSAGALSPVIPGTGKLRRGAVRNQGYRGGFAAAFTMAVTVYAPASGWLLPPWPRRCCPWCPAWWSGWHRGDAEGHCQPGNRVAILSVTVAFTVSAATPLAA
ncbi:Uncharacterised protein [Citrobacter freundii]|nr:Uncharacterised protein [Citrobacter freundii]